VCDLDASTTASTQAFLSSGGLGAVLPQAAHCEGSQNGSRNTASHVSDVIMASGSPVDCDGLL